MTAVFKRTQGKKDATAPETEVSEGARRCLAIGEMKPKVELIRFVIGPDQSVVPDLSENLPGHGLWVTASPDAIQLAAKKNLFAKAAKGTARPADCLAEDVARLLRKRCLEFLGLAKGAGIAVLGEAQTEAALRAGKLALYLHAPDATRALDNRKLLAECDLFSRDELGAAFGYEHIVYAGIMPHGLTEKLKLELNRLRSMIPVGKNEG
jgi:predicted RNA-binding protein YlxR (DUF448 family)